MHTNGCYLYIDLTKESRKTEKHCVYDTMNATTCGVYTVHSNMFFSDAAYSNFNYSKISNTGLIQGVTK